MLYEKMGPLSKTAKQLEITEEVRLIPVFQKVFLFQRGRTTRNITVEGLSLELFIIKQAEATYRGLFLVRPPAENHYKARWKSGLANGISSNFWRISKIDFGVRPGNLNTFPIKTILNPLA